MDKKLWKGDSCGKALCQIHEETAKKITTILFPLRPKKIISRQNYLKKLCAEIFRTFYKVEKRFLSGDEFYPSVHDPVFTTNLVSGFHDFSYRSVFYKILSLKHEFCELHSSERHTLFMGINTIVHVFSTFFKI
jgi:hypothetical protein